MQAARAGLTLIHVGIKKLREAGLGDLADGLEQLIAEAVQDAEDDIATERDRTVHTPVHTPAYGKPPFAG